MATVTSLVFFGFVIPKEEVCSLEKENKDSLINWREQYTQKIKALKSDSDETEEQENIVGINVAGNEEFDPIWMVHIEQDSGGMSWACCNGVIDIEELTSQTDSDSEFEAFYWLEQIKDFCEVMGITFQEPKWRATCSLQE